MRFTHHKWWRRKITNLSLSNDSTLTVETTTVSNFDFKVNVSDKLVYEIEFGQTMCENTTIVAEYQWTVYKKSSHLPLFIDGMDRKRFTKRRLMLPPCTLAPGHYRLEVKVNYKVSKILKIRINCRNNSKFPFCEHGVFY